MATLTLRSVVFRLERVSDEELKGSGPPAMQNKVALGPDAGFGVRPATVRPSEFESLTSENELTLRGSHDVN